MVKSKNPDNPLIATKFILEAKAENKAIIIRPYELLRATGGMYCALDDKKIKKVEELAELGCSTSDIRNSIGLNSAQYSSYINQGRLIEAYILGIGIDVDTDMEWESKISNGFELEDEDGQVITIHQGVLKYKLYRAIQNGRAKGSERDLTRIKEAANGDWKAAAYTLERRNPDYKRDKLIPEPAKVVINNTDNSRNTLIQNIRNIAKELEEQDKKRGLSPVDSVEQVIEAQVIKNE